MSDDRCKLCKFKYNNLPRVHKRQRAAEMLKDYGITPEDWLRMYKEQDGKCYLCSYEIQMFIGQYSNKNPHAGVVDHCHETGKIRGLLCNSCNLFISRIDTSILKNPLEYINRLQNYLV